MRTHVLISGTGRAGTTFLVALLTALGLDTGFTSSQLDTLPSYSYGGLECDVRESSAPRIVKAPWLCDHLEEVLSSQEVAIEHLIVPVRDLYSTAQSRRRVSLLGKNLGGLWGTDSQKVGVQEAILAIKFFNLVYAAVGSDVPVTFIEFPRLALDGEYLYSKLLFLFEPAGISFSGFMDEFKMHSKPERIHDFAGPRIYSPSLVSRVDAVRAVWKRMVGWLRASFVIR